MIITIIMSLSFPLFSKKHLSILPINTASCFQFIFNQLLGHIFSSLTAAFDFDFITVPTALHLIMSMRRKIHYCWCQ